MRLSEFQGSAVVDREDARIGQVADVVGAVSPATL